MDPKYQAGLHEVLAFREGPLQEGAVPMWASAGLLPPPACFTCSKVAHHVTESNMQ